MQNTEMTDNNETIRHIQYMQNRLLQKNEIMDNYEIDSNERDNNKTRNIKYLWPKVVTVDCLRNVSAL